jgi:hypothetical protein
MPRQDDFGDQASRERAVIEQQFERERSRVAHRDDDEDWPLLTALFAGLAVALIVNTFFGLMPG